MEGSSTTQIRMQSHAGYALVDIVIELAVSAARAFGHRLHAIAQRQNQLRARREMHRLSDHHLRDIGLSRGDIDRLFQ